jgi:hypothetical protein
MIPDAVLNEWALAWVAHQVVTDPIHPSTRTSSPIGAYWPSEHLRPRLRWRCR